MEEITGIDIAIGCAFVLLSLVITSAAIYFFSRDKGSVGDDVE